MHLVIEEIPEELLSEVVGGGRGKGFSIEPRLPKFEPPPETYPIDPPADLI